MDNNATITKLVRFQSTTVHSSIILIALLTISAGVLLQFLQITYRNRPLPKYYLVNPENKVMLAPTFESPNFALNQLLTWLVESITELFTIDFLNVDAQLAQSERFFTRSGYQSFIDAITTAGILDDIKQGKIVMSSVPTAFPVVSREYKDDYGYHWVIQLPMRLSFQSANEIRYQDVVQEISVATISTLESVRGLGIERLRVL